MAERSTTSLSSIGSVGIGAVQLNQRHRDELPRPRPENGMAETIRIFDCIVYLFYCNKHDKIALTRGDQSRCIWLPFITMPEGVTWEHAAQEGITLVIGKKDAEADAKTVRLPKMDISSLHFLRIQLSLERYFIRYTHFVQILETKDFPCCQDSPTIYWVDAKEIVDGNVERLWGPELKEFIRMLVNADLKFIHELCLEDVSSILNDGVYSKFLNKNRVNIDLLISAYEEYIEHCYPAILMSLESFRTFLIRFGYQKTDGRFPWIYNSIGFSRRGYIDFHEFFIGIICMEPETENDEQRLKMIYRYYDVENKQNLSLQEFLALIQELNPGIEAKKLRNIVDDLNRKCRGPEGQLTFEYFERAVKGGLLKGTERLCRSPKPILPQLNRLGRDKSEALASNEASSKSVSSSDKLKKKTKEVKSKDRGICYACRASKPKFGLHCVGFDIDGRCVQPLRLFDISIEETITPLRYSVEHVFGMNTICRHFQDIIRAAYIKNEPLMTAPEDLGNASRTIKTLCDFVTHVLLCEEKFLKINSPVLVIGSFYGRIDTLMTFEKTFWQSVPVLTHSLVFLGNFSGGGSKTSVEVICYLFALKIIAPNKVFLVRGLNETIDFSRELFEECQQKYSQEGKAIWQDIMKVFNRLPFAVLIDESILCTHSGIPKAALHIAKFESIPDVVTNVQKESPLAWEMLQNVPQDSEKSRSDTLRKQEFNFEIFHNFMHTNGLSHMIRAREMLPNTGYKLFYDSRCITVSSASKSFAVVALVDGSNEEIRLLKVAIDNRVKAKPKRQAAGFA